MDHPATIFDPARAEHAVETVYVEQVIDPLRITHAPDCVAKYRAAMSRGDRFPPISVLRVGTRRVVVDGHKRFTAYQMLGHSQIVVEVWPLRQFLRDQWSQVVSNLEKNRRILYFAFVDPPRAGRLMRSTLLHWKRVALCLMLLVRAESSDNA